MDAAGGHGFLLDQGSYSTLDVPGSDWTEAHGINASGQIVGYYIDAADGSHGFLAAPVQ
jgi:probable HAF family extracellular repeat protein